MSAPRPPGRGSKAPLGLLELVAIALGGMVGGGIFSILGFSVASVGVYTPVAIGLGGMLAALAAFSYVRLALHFRDEGATYSFFKLTYPDRPLAAAMIGWWVVFGYISTIALYAYTFASYAIAATSFADDPWARRGVAVAAIALFALVNAWSTRWMGRIEDVLVYTKVGILLVISVVLFGNGRIDVDVLLAQTGPFSGVDLVTVAAVTFVAYEGFQLVIHAMREVAEPERHIPRAIYASVAIATLLYVVIAAGAILAIPFSDIVARQEYALAAGAGEVLGPIGSRMVVAGALLATMSAIAGTLFGASRLMAVIAEDGHLPRTLAHREGRIPRRGIGVMAALASALVLTGQLRMIIEFGSITFMFVSLLMAVANHRLRHETSSHAFLTIAAMLALAAGIGVVLWHEARTDPLQLGFIVALYLGLTLGCWAYHRLRRVETP